MSTNENISIERRMNWKMNYGFFYLERVTNKDQDQTIVIRSGVHLGPSNF